MNEIKLKKINEYVYQEKLENGLTIIIYKTKGFNEKFAFFQTKYGSLNNEFIPAGKKEFKKYPLGIAHFLEHKLFENEENLDMFKLFSEDSAYVNAATSYDKTYYYFNCTDNFNKNLIRLIDMVQTPYFTNENVSKEKGIIGQEIDMYQNDPNQKLYDKLYYNSFINDPIKFDIAGSKKDISKITKEDLYECYNTFYNPSNMFLVVVGDVDEKEVINVIKKNQNKKKFNKQQKIVNKKIKEPKEVYKEEEIIKANVSIEKTGYAYKIKLKKETDVIKREERKIFLSLFLRTKFGELTNFTEDLIKDKIIKSYFNYSSIINNDYALITFSSDVLNQKEFEKIINKKLNDFNNLEEYFNLYKKSLITKFIKKFESPYQICSYLRYMFNEYNMILDDTYGFYEKLDFNKYYEFISNLNFAIKTKVRVIRNEE